ncbi:putative 3',5'-cyclic phosphodiesterase pde-3 [Trebouxia sp. C0009 RCD-2024]
MPEALSSREYASYQSWLDWDLQVSTGEAVSQPSADISPLMQACFSGPQNDKSSCIAQVDSKPIRVETAPGSVHSGVLHVIKEREPRDPEETRVAAMHRWNPVHTFMFDSRGKLLNANKAAKEACQNSAAGLRLPPGQDITLRSLFEVGLYPGGKEEAQEAYEEAYNAIFALQLQCHRHIQPHTKREGTLRWEMIEMWPMQDPVDSSPAVLVKRYNITRQKELEIQLFNQQEALQRHNQALEQDSLAMQEEKLQLEREAEALSKRLAAVMTAKYEPHSTGFDAETPIDKVLNVMHSYIDKGKPPAVDVVSELYQLLIEAGSRLRQPVALEEQLLKHNGLSSDVGKSMLQLLQGNVASRTKGFDDKVASQPFAASRTASQPILLTATFCIMPAVERMLLDAENNWQFDIFAFADATPGSTLSVLTFHLFKQAGMFSEFSVDQAKFWNFLQKIESGYRAENPYHNSVHAASVVQMTHMLLCHGGPMKTGAVRKLQLFCSCWSAATHDYEHGGLNNDFLIKTAHPLALTYNDQSPLENHHVAAASKLLVDPDCAYLASKAWKTEAGSYARSMCINQVLATDMKKHFDITSRFQAPLSGGMELQAAFKRTPPSSAGTTPLAMPDWESVKPEEKALVHQMVLKCADIGHLAVDPKTHKRWAYQLEEEFFRQGDMEKAAGLPVSALMDRSMKGGMTRSQLGFFNIVGIPLFKAMAELFEDAQPLLDGVLANFKIWEAAADEAAASTAPA